MFDEGKTFTRDRGTLNPLVGKRGWLYPGPFLVLLCQRGSSGLALEGGEVESASYEAQQESEIKMEHWGYVRVLMPPRMPSVPTPFNSQGTKFALVFIHPQHTMFAYSPFLGLATPVSSPKLVPTTPLGVRIYTPFHTCISVLPPSHGTLLRSLMSIGILYSKESVDGGKDSRGERWGVL